MPQLNRRPGTRDEGRGFSIRAEADRAEILLYDVIDPWYGISAKEFHNELKALGKISTIDVRINSPGGSIIEGTAIHSILKRQEAKVVAHVDGIAASIASVVAMAADEIVMAAGSYMMVHNPFGIGAGEAEDMRELAELLDKMKSQLVNIYAARTKRPAEEVSAFMDDETWFTAEEAVAEGFADRTSAQLALAASIDPNMFNHLPQELRGAAQMSQTQPTQPNPQDNTTEPIKPAAPPALPIETTTATLQPQPAGYHDLKAALPGADAEFIASQLEANATAAQAQSAWMAEQNRRLEATRKEAEAAKALADAQKMGVEPLGGGTNQKTGGDPIVAWNEALQAKITLGMSRSQAVRAVVRENPELHEEYLAAYNAARKTSRR